MRTKGHIQPTLLKGLSGKQPAYLELAAELEEDIRSGRLAPGSRLPPQRDVAAQRKLNLSTVSRAYRELQMRNLVVGSTRRGTIVTDGAGISAAPADEALGPIGQTIDLTVTRPSVEDFLEALADTLGDLPSDPRYRELQDYQPPEGSAWARRAGARWIALNGFERPAEDIVVTSGAQHALFAVISNLIDPDDVVATDRLTYYGLKALAHMFRFRIVALNSDEQGLSASELDSMCRRQRVKAVFTTPCLHNPTVVTMSEERRLQIAEVATRHDLVVIEDDVYGPMVKNRPPAIATLCPERTFHLSSLSKALAPGLRVGYLLSPPGRTPLMADAIRSTCWMPAPVSTLIATRWIEDGTANRILHAQAVELGERHRMVHDILQGADVASDPASMFIWLRLPSPWLSEDFAANTAARGVKVMPASAFVADREAGEHGVRVNLACASSREELATALRILAETLADRPRAMFTTI